MSRGVDDRLSGDFGLEDRRHRLSLVGQPALDPAKLRGVYRLHLHHLHMHLAAVVIELGAQRLGETLEGMLSAAVGSLERDAAIGQRRADLDDDTTIAWEHIF